MKSTWKKTVAAVAALPMLVALLPAATALADESVSNDTVAQQALEAATAQQPVALADNQANAQAANEGLEETGGITVANGDGNAQIVDHEAFGKVLNVSGSWIQGSGATVPAKAVGFFKDSTPFASTAWTLTMDVKNTNTAEATPTGNSDKMPAFAFGTPDKNLNIVAYSGKLIAGSVTANMSKKATVGAWSSMAVVYSEDDSTGSIAVYLDGEQVLAPTSIGYKLSEQTDGKAYLGHGFKTSFVANGMYDGINVATKAVSEADAKKVTADRLSSKLEQSVWDGVSLTSDPVVGDITLPSANKEGDAVSWKSGNPAVMSDDGKLVAAPDKNTDVAYTATVVSGRNGKTYTKQFTVNVLSNDVKAQKDLEALTIANANDVRGNITLPETGKYGSKIEWTSSDPAVVTDKASDDGAAAGVVNRPADKDATVVLTAKVAGTNLSKRFVLTVRKAAEQTKTTDYVFAHFTGSEGRSTDEQIYLATSQDGLQWKDTHDNTYPVLTWENSQTGNSRGKDNGVRDPYLVRSPEGDTVYLIATELSINQRGGWGNAAATSTGSKNLIVWETHDFVTWSKPRAVDVASKIPGAGCAWAPEAIWDEAKQQYIVYWATASDQSNESGDRMNMYYSTTRDFITFSDPVKWIDRAKSVIDTTMIKADDGWYYRVSGDTYLGVERSKDPYATTVTKGSTVEDGYYNTSGDENQWTYIGKFGDLTGTGLGGGSLEGPELFRYNTDDVLNQNGKEMKYGLMWDQYAAGKGYLPFYSANLGSTDTTDWAKASSVNFGSLKKRHGTILPVTAAEYEAIMKAYDGNQVKNQFADAVKDSQSLTVLGETDRAVKDVTMKVGESRTFTAVANDPDNVLSNVEWSSSQSEIADFAGKTRDVKTDSRTLTATKIGKTLVTVKAGELSATFNVTVEKADVDWSKLDAAVKTAEGKTESDYTAESWASFAKALAAAKAERVNENATQATADAATKALNDALGKLVSVSVGDEDADAKPGVDSDTKTESDDKADQSADKSTGESDGKSLSNTGAAVAAVAGVAVLLAAAGVALTVLRKRSV